jgi:hypothetical protein
MEKHMERGFIVDRLTGKNVANIRYGVVYRDDSEGAKVATVRDGKVYDLEGMCVGYLNGTNVTGSPMPDTFAKLLNARVAAQPKPAPKPARRPA